MDYIFSDKISSLKPSAIREILKATSDPGVIPLAAGNPSAEAFPVEEVKKITEEILKEDPILALQYGVTEGYNPLRELISSYMKEKYNIGKESDSIIITAGAQQIMDLTTKVLLNEGDTVICEAPSFIGSLNCFRSYNAKLCGVEVEADGINVEKLEEALKTEKNVKFIYTIPNFQNPSGVTMSLEKRKKVYELAKKYNVLILEDNPYGDLRVSGEHLPSIKSFDEDGIVIYGGSFSKILSPGIRVGYVIANEKLIAKMTVGKQATDVHTPMLTQLIVYKWMKEYDFEKHIEKICGIYKSKLELMCDNIDKHFGDKVTYVRPEGGLFVWCRLRDDIDMLSFCAEAVKNKVAVVPGTAFMMNADDKTQCFRMNFSTPSDEKIVKGIEILGNILSKY
ncbi:MAG: PLP-dependent aminotransferase family protein [Ruminococcaceae bacterium]|nr:PLP-dependent aminotransferase family protein [Oscillospiraceae bacterium]